MREIGSRLEDDECNPRQQADKKPIKRKRGNGNNFEMAKGDDIESEIRKMKGKKKRGGESSRSLVTYLFDNIVIQCGAGHPDTKWTR